jgi:3-deoxy-manno-octulosonate cytidylyltransferase (CMP-KDO synthetase)
MSRGEYESGSDRIAEAVADMEVDIIINVQGDEPFVKKKPLMDLLAAFSNENFTGIEVASLMHEIHDESQVADGNVVKVVVDKHMKALYFSRSAIPFQRDKNRDVAYYKHIGIYAYRKQALMNFTQWEMTPLESAEKLEQLRYIENGIKIHMVLTDESPISIDTPEDLAKAKKWLETKQLK